MPETEQQAPPRRLRRSRDRKIAGVAAGIGEYFGVDPVLIRLGFVLAVFAGGAGLLLYLVGWLVIPTDDDPSPKPIRFDTDASAVVGVVLLILAALVILPFSFGWGGGTIVALALIAGGVYLLSQRPSRESPREAPEPPEPPEPIESAAPPAVPETAVVAPPPPVAPPQPREPSTITPVTLGAVLMVAGGAVAADLAGWFDVSVTGTFAVLLLVVGVGLAVSAFVGRAPGLIAVGLLLSLGLAVSSVLEPALEDGVGERTFAPTTLAELEDSYSLGAGRLVVDLTELDLEGQTREVSVDLNFGEAEVYLPFDVPVEVRAESNVGELVVLGREDDGISNEIRVVGEGTEPGRLVIELDVGFGRGEVQRGQD